MLKTVEFLDMVVTGDKGWFVLAFGNNGVGWKEEWYEWPTQKDAIAERAEAMASQTNVYFSTYLFADKSTTKDNVLFTRTIQADLDEADINSLPIPPNVLVQTSPGRHQGYWILDRVLDPEVHEILSRKLTYSIPKCDRSGWPLGRKVRVANTINYKYLDGTKPVTVVAVSAKHVTPDQLELLPDVPKHVDDIADEEFLNEQIEPSVGPQELLFSIKDKIPPTVYLQYNAQQTDRSAALWALMCAAFRAGLSRAEVFHLGKHSANNKFAQLHYHADRELAKDVLRAEAVVQSGKTDARALIANARKLGGPAAEKRRYMLECVQGCMQDEGVFYHTSDDSLYYIRSDIGRPITLSSRSEYLWTLMEMEFGLNPSETEHTYIIHGLVNTSRAMPMNGRMSVLSHYDEGTEMVLLHSGRTIVYEITKHGTRALTDGAHNVVFPWHPSNEVFRLDQTGLDVPWEDVLFEGTVDNIIGLSREEAMSIMKTWFLFILFRQSAVSRPIIALFGQPGSGKSTTFRRIYALLYGKQRGLSSVTTPEDFDTATNTEPLVVLDNVDTWASWLPDRLAASISNIDITRRKLYTDSDIVVLKRQAILAVTAHNPRFGREDVTDRLLLFNMRRLEHFEPEAPLIDKVYNLRNKIWYEVAQDVSRVLNTPKPDTSEIPQMRVEDFARVGFWIARALGYEDAFVRAVSKIRTNQKMFSMEEEQLLVDAIVRLVQSDKKAAPTEERWRTPGQLWSALSEIHTNDTPGFQKQYRNGMYLGKKLWNLMDALKEIFDVKFKFDTVKGSRAWYFGEKDGATK